MSTAPAAASGGAPLSAQAIRQATRALYLLVFVAGGILMGIEIAGSRILAPSFGTSIFVWGSLIGLFMGAMALGYWLGGALADRAPSFGLLATLCSAAGLYTFIMIPYLGPYICEAIGRSVTHRMAGPLLASLVLFFVPSFLLAMVSPYATKLVTHSLAGLGGIVGRISALSTFGSIVGTLATTFILIPVFQVSTVLHALGIALIAVAVISLVLFKRAVGGLNKDDRQGAAFMSLVGLACLEGALVFPVEPYVIAGDRLLLYQESEYHDIAVTESVVESRTGRLTAPEEITRWLKFNENIESGIFPYREAHKNAVEYTDLLHYAVVWARAPKKVLVVGGGGGIAPVQYARDYPSVETVDVLELDDQVRRIAQEYFLVPRGGKIRFQVGDARMNLKTAAGPYDVAILDAYSSGGQIPFHLLTWEFLRDVKAKLAPGGVLVTNLITAVQNAGNATERPADILLAEYKTLCADESQAQGLPAGAAEVRKPLFKQVYIFPKVWRHEGGLLGSEDKSRNVIVIATDEEQARTQEELIAAAKALTAGKDPVIKVDPAAFVWHAEHYYARGIKAKELEDVPVLRDNYAPVDTMYRPVKREEAVWHWY